MIYKEKIVPAIFLERPNRFIAKVLMDSKEIIVHVKNTGRCKELLLPGCKVYLAMTNNPNRRTIADLIAVEKQYEDGKKLLINMDSTAPNAVAAEWVRDSGLFSPDAIVKREVRYGNSRFDIMVSEGEKNSFIEVKGVTLEENGVAKFPDAPTERGVKHLKEMAQCASRGYGTYVLFVVQMKEARLFAPNTEMHPEFASALKEAMQAGVKVKAITCNVTPSALVHGPEIEVIV